MKRYQLPITPSVFERWEQEKRILSDQLEYYHRALTLIAKCATIPLDLAGTDEYYKELCRRLVKGPEIAARALRGQLLCPEKKETDLAAGGDASACGRLADARDAVCRPHGTSPPASAGEG